MNTLSDVFKKSFLEGYASAEIDTISVIVALMIAFVLSMYLFFAYRVITRKTFYSKNFNLSLVGVALITAAIIVTIQSSIVVSLGMVGALSIVRFRTAIKDPMDLMFLFWSISIGIICGAGFAQYAIILSIVLTIAILVLDRVPVARAPMILVVNASDLDVEERIMQIVRQYAQHPHVKSRNMTSASLDLIVELRTAEGGELVRKLMKAPGIVSASLMTHDGETTF
ncbi:MAG: DUF4956 domain-containing protein [Eubacteriales bacterium]|nr:DUF4956 domain-containing protein [Eubacteriales bacterium]